MLSIACDFVVVVAVVADDDSVIVLLAVHPASLPPLPPSPRHHLPSVLTFERPQLQFALRLFPLSSAATIETTVKLFYLLCVS